MKKKDVFSGIIIFTAILINNAYSTLIEECDLDERNYVKVNVWLPPSGSSYIESFKYALGIEQNVGHASIEIAEKDEDRIYISYWPSTTTRYNIQKYTQDCATEGRKEDSFFKLYSINRNSVFNHYNSENFCNSSYSFVNNPVNNTHNCSSAVLSLLKAGSINDLFEPRESMTTAAKTAKVITRCLSVTALTTYGGAQSGTFLAGPYGGAVGAVGGLLYGVFDLAGQSRKAQAELMERDDDLSELVVDPNRINSLMLKARNNERTNFYQTVKSWDD